MESVLVTTSDGHELAGDIGVPRGASRGGVVMCHPHPQFGGDRFNPVVDAVWGTLPEHGWLTLRFDFRNEFGGGVAERLDIVAAIDELAARVDGPIVAAGYSFGAAVALGTDDDRIAGFVAIAPPLAMMQVGPSGRPTLVLTPEHDQFTGPDAARIATAEWPDTELRVVESVDHFLLGRAGTVASIAADWLDERFGRHTAD